MKAEDLEPNSVAVVISLDEEGNTVASGFASFDEDFDEDDQDYLCFMLRGMTMMAEVGPNVAATVGSALAMADELEAQDFTFEPSEELVDAINGSKVVPINGKKRPN
tara:strand:+ start:262 stop:582 length:321 start_codon:yes stop_codon:yes gene_type:complete